ncbi:microtubule-associated tyrosine carboxypeptidase 1-like [Ptychodera flava]|uniref:microtubule-associated tyrosine carboxypeptidase 1-like n=1 Tax=Ptychodera flava TaxID=63121 RepID=UPI00396A87DA
MKKKKKKSQKSGRSKVRIRITPNRTSIKTYDATPKRFVSKIDPLNLEEQKQRFLKYGLVPRFELRGSPDRIQDMISAKRGQIRFQYLKDAKRILDHVYEKYGTGEDFLYKSFGPRISASQATPTLSEYLKLNMVDGMLSIGWTKDLSCSGRMSMTGPNTKLNKPEARRFSLWLKDSVDNAYLREGGIVCLADHEIGTHFFRSLNDGLQPWYSNRDRFGLRGVKSLQLLETEEGLATVNTHIQAKVPLLFMPALVYYTSCKATEMTFEELYDHLQHYVKNPEQRWKHVMRVKRGLENPNDLGGYGKDQCYFAGAVEVLRNIENIDFQLLYAGKLCLDEVSRVKRIARMECIKLPHFLQNIEQYKKRLRYMAQINGLIPKEDSSLRSPRSRSRKCRKASSSSMSSASTTSAGTNSSTHNLDSPHSLSRLPGRITPIPPSSLPPLRPTPPKCGSPTRRLLDRRAQSKQTLLQTDISQELTEDIHISVDGHLRKNDIDNSTNVNHPAIASA